jgi:hypothetical protein
MSSTTNQKGKRKNSLQDNEHLFNEIQKSLLENEDELAFFATILYLMIQRSDITGKESRKLSLIHPPCKMTTENIVECKLNNKPPLYDEVHTWPQSKFKDPKTWASMKYILVFNDNLSHARRMSSFTTNSCEACNGSHSGSHSAQRDSYAVFKEEVLKIEFLKFIHDIAKYVKPKGTEISPPESKEFLQNWVDLVYSAIDKTSSAVLLTNIEIFLNEVKFLEVVTKDSANSIKSSLLDIDKLRGIFPEKNNVFSASNAVYLVLLDNFMPSEITSEKLLSSVKVINDSPSINTFIGHIHETMNDECHGSLGVFKLGSTRENTEAARIFDYKGYLVYYCSVSSTQRSDAELEVKNRAMKGQWALKIPGTSEYFIAQMGIIYVLKTLFLVDLQKHFGTHSTNESIMNVLGFRKNNQMSIFDMILSMQENVNALSLRRRSAPTAADSAADSELFEDEDATSVSSNF